ncbi:hypothetical protein JTB14_001891 [Gonioctena quinquepunctata]|nr:hypothetical protein JTB14_001891 [Gonioctena quinquepunctata]
MSGGFVTWRRYHSFKSQVEIVHICPECDSCGKEHKHVEYGTFPYLSSRGESSAVPSTDSRYQPHEWVLQQEGHMGRPLDMAGLENISEIARGKAYRHGESKTFKITRGTCEKACRHGQNRKHFRNSKRNMWVGL